MPSIPENTPRQRLAGIALMCVALLCFALLDACAKYLSPRIGALQVVWFRYALSVAALALLLNPLTAPGIWRTRNLKLQLARSAMLFLSTLFNFLALRELQLAQSMAIVFAVPLLVALAAGPMLGEWPGPRRIAAIIVGFLGVLVVARPGFGGLPPAALWSVAGVFAYALYNIITRMLAAYDSAQTTLVYSGVAAVALLAPLVPFLEWVPMGATEWALAGACAFFGTFGHFLVILASRRAPASVLTPFIYTQIIWMIALGYYVFGDTPDAYTLAGAGIVIASGLYLLNRERLRGADAARSIQSIR